MRATSNKVRPSLPVNLTRLHPFTRQTSCHAHVSSSATLHKVCHASLLRFPRPNLPHPGQLRLAKMVRHLGHVTPLCLTLEVPKLSTAKSMKVASADTAFVVRKVWRARRVVRNRSALRTRGAGHCAAANKVVSCVYRCTAVYCCVPLCTGGVRGRAGLRESRFGLRDGCAKLFRPLLNT